MTVNAAVTGDSRDGSDLQNKSMRGLDYLSGIYGKESRKAVAEIDQESGGSSSTEEIGSPKSVEEAGMRRGRKKAAFVHNQVMRIREEDSLIGDDIAEGLGVNYKEKVSGRNHHVQSPAAGVVFYSRPILPCSPLGGKAARRQSLALN